MDEELEPRVSYSRLAVRRFAERLKRAGDSRPRDATVRLVGERLRRVRERPGVEVRVDALVRAIGLELLRPESNHVVAAPVTKTPARLTLADLPRRYRHLIVIDRDRFTLHFHGTDEVSSLGRRASHGCIRMRIRDVVELYRRVLVWTPVYIA